MADGLLSQSLRPTTRRNYGRVHERYLQHCRQMHVAAHPVSWDSLATFVTTLHQQDLRPRSIKAYVSAVLSEERLHFGDVPAALMERLSRLYQGVENVAVEHHGPQLRPAVSAQDVVQVANKLLAFDSATASMAAAVTFGFLFALRASTITAVHLSDIDIQQGRLVFAETTRKSRATRTIRHVEIDVQQCRPAAQLWAYFKRIKAKHARQDNAPAFAFLRQSRLHAAPAITMAIRKAYAAAGLRLPAGELTSYALRRGAAVSMHALGVSLPRMLSWGAWQSYESMKPYVKDRAWHSAHPCDRTCFGHLLQ